MRFRRTSGRRAAERAGPAPRGTARRRAGTAALALPLLLAGCLYGFSGGGGFPEHIRSVYIDTFENETVQFELTSELFSQMLDRVPSSLGVNVAGEEVADAVVRGRIVRYEDVAQNYRSDDAAPGGFDVLQHQVQVVVAVQIIDVRRNIILWEGSSVSGRGEYLPDSETAEVGRLKAIENVVQQILDGAQSQW